MTTKLSIRALISKFNGEHVHPRQEQLSIVQWQNWKHAFSRKSADEVFEYDAQKKTCSRKTRLESVYYLVQRCYNR
jgi:hypothetical protein